MPIKRLKTHIVSSGGSARLGFLKKGAPKGEKRPGKDLDHYRFDPKLYPDELTKIFHDAYGKEPRTIRVRLPYDTAFECLPNHVEARKGKTLQWRGDGEFVYTWLENGKYHQGQRPQSDFDQTHAKETGHLKIYIPELVKAGYDGVVWALTNSAHDITTLWDRLCHYERMSRGNLSGIEFALTRVLKPVTDHKTGRTKDMWLMELTSDAEWMRLQLASRKQATYALASGAHPPAIDQETGEIVPGYVALPSGSIDTEIYDEPVEVEPEPIPMAPPPPKPQPVPQKAPKVKMPTPADKKYFSETMQSLYGSKWEQEEAKVVEFAKSKKPVKSQPDGLTQTQMRYANSLLKGKMNKINDIPFLVGHVAKFTGFGEDVLDAAFRNVAEDNSDTVTAPIPMIAKLAGFDEFGQEQMAQFVAEFMGMADDEVGDTPAQSGIPF